MHLHSFTHEKIVSKKLKTGCLMGMVFSCLFVVAVFSQTRSTVAGLQPNIKFEHFTTEDGLGHNQVTCILQDRQGFLWVGTLGGLWRYDGHDFKFARYAHDDSSALSHPEIQSLYEDSKGNLWVGMQRGGLNLFDRETGRSIRSPKPYFQPSQPRLRLPVIFLRLACLPVILRGISSRFRTG